MGKSSEKKWNVLITGLLANLSGVSEEVKAPRDKICNTANSTRYCKILLQDDTLVHGHLIFTHLGWSIVDTLVSSLGKS